MKKEYFYFGSNVRINKNYKEAPELKIIQDNGVEIWRAFFGDNLDDMGRAMEVYNLQSKIISLADEEKKNE